MMKSQESPPPPPPPPPPWEVLNLVANYLDPKALAVASCVNKSWSTTMSSDHLWEPICSTLYPSLFNLHLHAAAASSYGSFRRLYALGSLANNRRVQKPLKPKLSLKDIIFAIDIYNNDSCISTILKNGYDLKVDKNGIFRFDIDMDDDDNDEKVVVVKGIDKLRITWNVVLEGFKSVFSMMECNGKGSFVLGLEGWFSKELPPSSGCCCCSGGKSGVVADLRLGLREVNGEMVVEKISVGVLSIVSWRYVCIDDALRYLQYFLL